MFKNAVTREIRSRILITSRDRQLATNLGAHEHPVDVLDDAAALQLLAEWANQDTDRLPAGSARSDP